MYQNKFATAYFGMCSLHPINSCSHTYLWLTNSEGSHKYIILNIVIAKYCYWFNFIFQMLDASHSVRRSECNTLVVVCDLDKVHQFWGHPGTSWYILQYVRSTKLVNTWESLIQFTSWQRVKVLSSAN